MIRHPRLIEMARVARDRRRLVREWFPLDVPAFVKQVKVLPVFREAPRSIARTKVKIVYTAFQTGGRAYGDRLARIRVSPSASLAWVLETIVHELVHCALPDGTHHNERFRRTLARAAKELWGVEADPNPANERGRVRRYALDENLEEWLRVALVAGDIDYPKREAPPAEDVRRKAESDARVEKRRMHAERMLSLAETRLRRAQTLTKKWRAKVRRYERLAAKRGLRPA